MRSANVVGFQGEVVNEKRNEKAEKVNPVPATQKPAQEAQNVGFSLRLLRPVKVRRFYKILSSLFF